MNNTLAGATDQGCDWFMVLGSCELHQCLARRVDLRQEIAGTSRSDRRSKKHAEPNCREFDQAMGDCASHNRGLVSSVQSLRPRAERHPGGGGFGVGSVPNALRASEREASDKPSMLQGIARDRFSRGQECRGGGEPACRGAGLCCGNFSDAAARGGAGACPGYRSAACTQFRRVYFAAEPFRSRASRGFDSTVVPWRPESVRVRYMFGRSGDHSVALSRGGPTPAVQPQSQFCSTP
jgi:hypothetical protein